MKLKLLSILIMGLTAPTGLMAQTDTYQGLLDQYRLEITLGLAVVVCFLVLLVLIVALNVMQAFVRMQRQAQMERDGVEVKHESQPSWYQQLMSGLTDAVPINQEAEVMTDHEYDGIRELDNNLPPWWKYMFYLTIVFSVGYLAYYHVLGTGLSQEEEYQEEMAQATMQMEAYKATLAVNIDETNVTFNDAPEALASGKQLFIQYCAACHANDGGGGVGPNLTDSYWIHGGDIKSIFYTIKYGVAQKGMISWQNQLTPEQMQQVSSFIVTLKGTIPQNPKDPQGELEEPAKPTADSLSVTSQISMR